jgi:hypothetical protein
MVSLLQLTRLALVFTAVSNSWLMIFLAYGLEPQTRRNTGLLQDYPLWAFLILGAAVAAGLHTYGIALNDLLDARYDRLFSPHRPLAAGRVGQNTAVVLCVGSLLLASTAAIFMGKASTLLFLLAAALVLFYNLLGKFVPAAGILIVGAVRALNMILPNPDLSFAWPVWVTMTHVVACWTIAYQIEGKRPRLQPASWGLVCGGWGIGTLLLLYWSDRTPSPAAGHHALWLGPVLAAAAFALAALMTLRRAGAGGRTRHDAGAAFLRLALLWLIVYDAAWLAGAGLYVQALTHLGLLALAYGSMRLMSAVAHLTDPALTYRLRAQPPASDAHG